jgi:hypothetical protein
VQNLALDGQLENRLLDRETLLTGLDRIRKEVDQSGAMTAMDRFSRKATELLLSSQARTAFDLSQEPEAIKARYGHHAWGYRALMARRLVEAGCKFVTVIMENPYVSGVPFLKQGTYNWDSHAVNCHIYDDARVRFLYARGLDRRVLLVVTGEFGRTPRIEQSVGTQTQVRQPGRDHWPQSMSLIVSGGGLRMGQVIGSTNARGEHPKDRPLSPNDLWATMFRHLGIDYEHNLIDHTGRPLPILPDGAPIAELI